MLISCGLFCTNANTFQSKLSYTHTKNKALLCSDCQVLKGKLVFVILGKLNLIDRLPFLLNYIYCIYFSVLYIKVISSHINHPMCMWDNSVSPLTWSRRRGWWIQRGRKWLLTPGCTGRVAWVCWVIPQHGGGEMRMDPGHSYCCHLASLPVCGGKCVSVRQLVCEEILHSELLWLYAVDF